MGEDVTYEHALEKVDTIVADAGFDLAAVPHAVMAIYLITQMTFEISLGGVPGWLTNQPGKRARQTVSALEEVGASRCATIVSRMLDLLQSRPIPAEEAARAARVWGLPETTHSRWQKLADELLEWPDDIDALLRTFVQKHASSFV